MINILWINKINDMWEGQYINKFLFGDLNPNIYEETIQNDTVLDNSIIVYSCDKKTTTEQFKQYLKKFKNKKYFLFHLSDEFLLNDCSDYAGAKHVFRNYYNKNITSNKVTTLPLGWKSGFMNSDNHIKFYKDKKYVSCFIGQIKKDRHEVVEQIKKSDKNFIYITDSFNSKKSLSVEEQIKIYKETVFVPCPIGNWNVDTFRICEVLECGSIPLIKNYNGQDYYKSIFGTNHCIPNVSSWNEIPLFFNELKKQGIDDNIITINNWYSEYKTNLKNKLYILIG